MRANNAPLAHVALQPENLDRLLLDINTQGASKAADTLN